MSHAILLPDFDPLNLEALSTSVAAAYGISPTDAKLRIRQGWGFLEWNSTEARATEIAQRVQQAGSRANAIEIAAMRVPGDAEVLSGFSLSDTGFGPELRTPGVVPPMIPWNEVAIVAAGGFSEEAMHREALKPQQSTAAGVLKLGVLLATGMPVGMFKGRPKKKAKNQPAAKTLFISFGQLVTVSGAAYFFNADHFNFAGLGEAKVLSSFQNYRAFVALLAKRSGARLNMGARCVVEKMGMSTANYESVADFEREVLWMLNKQSVQLVS